MSDSKRNIELRKILMATPTADNWNRLCQLLALWPDNEGRDEAIELAAKGLEKWPEQLREVKSSWSYLYDEQGVSAVGTLVRGIAIYRRSQFANTELVKISTAANLKDLKFLNIYKSDIAETGIKALTTATFSRGLSHLLLENLVLTNSEQTLLFTKNNFQSLEILALRGVDFQLHGLSLLKNLKGNPIRHLDLSHNILGDESIEVLLDLIEQFPLDTLLLRKNYFNQKSLEIFTKNKNIEKLKILDISKNRIRENGRKIVQSCPFLKNTKIIFE